MEENQQNYIMGYQIQLPNNVVIYSISMPKMCYLWDQILIVFKRFIRNFLKYCFWQIQLNSVIQNKIANFVTATLNLIRDFFQVWFKMVCTMGATIMQFLVSLKQGFKQGEN